MSVVQRAQDRPLSSGLIRGDRPRLSVAVAVNAFESPARLRRIKEKASRFSAGMNPTIAFTNRRSTARQDIPRWVVHAFK